MKRILTVLLVLLISFGCVPKKETGRIIEVAPDEIMRKMDREDSFFLYITLTDCPVCVEYKKTIVQLVKDCGVDLYHMEVDQYDPEEWAELSMDYLDVLTDAPDSFVIIDGAMKFERVGKIDLDQLKGLLTDYGFTK